MLVWIKRAKLSIKGKNDEFRNRFSKIKGIVIGKGIGKYIKWKKYSGFKNVNDKPFLLIDGLDYFFLW